MGDSKILKKLSFSDYEYVLRRMKKTGNEEFLPDALSGLVRTASTVRELLVVMAELGDDPEGALWNEAVEKLRRLAGDDPSAWCDIVEKVNLLDDGLLVEAEAKIAELGILDWR
ncbi:hypothetical protein COY93_04835 [Candidatus Uhrbacteria bacterium CG_4_10_14_0_8_um_filter_58_22]|uniref:Uncharacterized protein n=1 Tax=Candidatus Uhrbacteria bacterium CG_4_10_14_0_8_um_filter_58_22 TaxID=1975029 RepID=A0A2M7Q8M3_9BACT|nr:MAG: hypothetical protein AUJ19_04885 [Parcubacteria group bacterium CG1_02_58_44]PIY61722.1 MAG: hypothetical protein COY93_04835 [Candidatus Uhrbacteria bacterium CG_4_10_14_0_8_um_filter_58_22]